VREFSLAAARILTRAVAFDGVCVVTMDPATSLPTSEVVLDGLPPETAFRMAEIEVRDRDFNTFDALVRSGRPAATLSEATGGDLERSVRHSELRAPNGFGDELRAVLVSDGAIWGGLTLLRGADRGAFAPDETKLLGQLSRHLAEGLRRSVLLTALSREPRDHGHPAGLALLAADNSITTMDAAAEAWLAQLRADRSDAPVPAVVAAVATRARAIANGREAPSGLARARVATASGAWLVVRGSTLGEGDVTQTAVTIEPAAPHELAPLIADACGLTDRERAVTQLVAQGLATDAIARRLYISPWTVQDHLKSTFEKVGVSTRGELVARVFFDHYVPRLSDGTPVGWNGAFGPPALSDG
jgi:DNA-binding CsgD family transcriptional regulator